MAFSAPPLAQATGQSQAKPPDPKTQAKPPDPKAQVKPADPTAKPIPDMSAKPGMTTVPPVVPASVPPPPPDYVIGPDDVLQVLFWREKDNSAEVVVRPDGLISLPMLNDIQAGGLTPEQLRQKVVSECEALLQG